MTIARRKSAEKAGFRYLEVPLAPGAGPKAWLCPSGSPTCVERAVLSHFERDGWTGSWSEGGALLNLIKCMSFPQMPLVHRRTYIEAIYAQNIAFDEHKVSVPRMLDALAIATPDQVQRNFELMLEPGPFGVEMGGMTFSSSGSIREFFPHLETWMLLGLMGAAGHDLLHRIATIFAQNPYEYRRGWPDITMWRGAELRFVEVKAPGDSLGASQRTIANTFARPLGLDFVLANVVPVTI